MSETLLILRGSKGLYLVNGQKPYDRLFTLSDLNNVRSVDVSNDGNFLAYADNQSVKVVSLPDCKVLFEKTGVSVNHVKLSPKATVLATWHHVSQNNLNLYKVSDQTLLSSKYSAEE